MPRDFALRFRCPMLPPMDGGERHCASCGRTVTDLTGRSREQVSAFLAANSGSACVRIALGMALAGQAAAGEIQYEPTTEIDGLMVEIDPVALLPNQPLRSSQEPQELRVSAEGWADPASAIAVVNGDPAPFYGLMAGNAAAEVHLRIDPSGAVALAAPAPPPPEDAETSALIARVLSMRFPPSPAGGVVTVRLLAMPLTGPGPDLPPP